MIEAKMHRFNFSKSITGCKIYKPNTVSQPLSTDNWSRTNGASLIWKQIHFRNHIRICISVKIWISVDGTNTIFKFSMENNNCSLIYAMKKLSDCYHSVIWRKKEAKIKINFTTSKYGNRSNGDGISYAWTENVEIIHFQDNSSLLPV